MPGSESKSFDEPPSPFPVNNAIFAAYTFSGLPRSELCSTTGVNNAMRSSYQAKDPAKLRGLSVVKNELECCRRQNQEAGEPQKDQCFCALTFCGKSHRHSFKTKNNRDEHNKKNHWIRIHGYLALCYTYVVIYAHQHETSRFLLSARERLGQELVLSPTLQNSSRPCSRDPFCRTGTPRSLSNPHTCKNRTSRKRCFQLDCFSARERTRTSTPLRATPPQGVMSTNFNTRAQYCQEPRILRLETLAHYS